MHSQHLKAARFLVSLPVFWIASGLIVVSTIVAFGASIFTNASAKIAG